MFELLLQVCKYPCSDARSRPLVWFVIFGVAWLVATWVAKRKKGGTSMKATWNIAVVVLLIGAVVAVLALKRADERGRAPAPGNESPAAVAAPAAAAGPVPATEPAGGLPRLVDLGSDTCIPCKMMVPVLDGLRKEYAGRLSVEFYDVRKDPSQAARYGIRVIPTQIFYDAAGNERFRHEGFFSKEDILAKWNELGVKLGDTP